MGDFAPNISDFCHAHGRREELQRHAPSKCHQNVKEGCVVSETHLKNMTYMKTSSRYEVWRKKLSYLINNHGGVTLIAHATGLKPKTIDRIVKGSPASGHKRPPHLDQAAAGRIERSLDLPEGWFDAPVFLPSRM